MSAYSIELPGIVLAGLYKRTVVQGEGPALTGGRPAAPVKAPAGEKAPVTAAAAQAPPAAVKAPPPPVQPALANTTEAAPVAFPAPPAAPQPAPKPAPVAAAPPPEAGTYKFLGNNRQQVTIVVRFKGEAFIPEQHLQLLTKMLGACKLNLGDVAIVNDATQPVHLPTLKEQLGSRRVLLFGIAPDAAGLPLSFPTFKDQDYAGTTYLYTPPLEELNQETEEGKLLKRRLWDCLRKIFNV